MRLNGLLYRIERTLLTLTVFLAPMNYLRLDSLYFTAGDLAGACTFFVMLANRRVPLQPLGGATRLWLFSFQLFVGGIMVGSIVNGNPIAGIVMFLQYSYSLILLPLILCSRPVEQTIFLMKIFVLSMALIILHGIYLLTFVENPDVLLVSPTGRLRSLIERENATAAIAAIAIIFTFFLFQRRSISFIRFAVLIFILFYGILLTGSNTGLLAAAAGISILLLITGSMRLIVVTLALGLVSAFVILSWGEYVLPEIFRERVLGAITAGDLEQAGTFGSRVNLIREAFAISNGTILIGLGADQYRVLSAYGAPVHNIYLLTLSEGGIVSVLGLLGFVCSGVFLAWTALRTRQHYMSGALTLTIVLLFAALLNAFAHFYARFWNVPLILALSLSAMHSIAPSRRLND